MENKRYKLVDNGIRYYSEKLEIAENLGFEYVSEAYEKMYNSGMSASQIGETFDLEKDTILYSLKLLGVKKRGKGGPNGAKLKSTDVVRIRKSKKSALKLAIEYDVSKSCIYAIRSRMTWKNVA